MVQSAAQKLQPPPPPPPKAAAQPAASGQAQPAQAPAPGATGAAPKPATTQTGYSTQDGFQTQAQPAIARAPQGDTFEALMAKPSGGGAGAAPAGLAAPETGIAAGTIGQKLMSPEAKIALLKMYRPPVVEDPAQPPPDPNDPTAGMTPDELEAYNNLSPAERAEYDRLHEEAATNTQKRHGDTTATPSSSVEALQALLTSGQFSDFLAVEKAVAGDPQATQDLHEMLFQGLLPGDKSADGRNTLAILAELADPNTPLQPGLEDQRGAILGSLLHDINHPEQIQQDPDSPECAAAIFANVMATGNPAEYARIIAGLAQHGEVTIDSPMMAAVKQALGIEPNTLKLQGGTQSLAGGEGGTSATQQLFGPAFMQAAQEGEGLFGLIKRALGLDGGVTGEQFMQILNMGQGPDWDMFLLPPDDVELTPEQQKELEETTTQMLETATPENPVLVNIDGHWIKVTGVNPDGSLVYEDPDPTDEDVPPPPPLNIDDVVNDASAIVYQEDAPGTGDVNVPDWMKKNEENASWDKEGGGGTRGGGVGTGGN